MLSPGPIACCRRDSVPNTETLRRKQVLHRNGDVGSNEQLLSPESSKLVGVASARRPEKGATILAVIYRDKVHVGLVCPDPGEGIIEIYVFVEGDHEQMEQLAA